MALSRDNIKAANEARELYEALKMMRNPQLLRMQDMRAQIGGDIALPLPEVDKMERPAVANLIAIGVDQSAMQVASVFPNISFPVLSTTDIAQRRSDDSRRAAIGWMEMNAWDLLTRRRARHLEAYGETIVSISPAPENHRDKRHIPRWRVRNPLSSFPAPNSNPDDMTRDFCIFVNHHPMSWFMKNYPTKLGQLFPGKANAVDRYEVLEYVDDVETLLIGIGSASETTDWYGRPGSVGVPNTCVLERVPNPIGRCPVVVVGRITLDKIEGKFHQYLGIERRRATLDALNTIAIFKNIFADEWAVSTSNSNSSARIVRRADGKKGIIGIVDKGQLQIVRPPLNQEIGLALDRYEGATRQAGIPMQYGGENPAGIRSGRQADSVMSAAIDMDLQESQALIARSTQIELGLCIDFAKELWGTEWSSFYMSESGKLPNHDYIPNDTFATDFCRVRYPMPGRDANGMTVRFLQMHGAGEMSLESMRELDPDIEDAALEADRVEIEDLNSALKTGIEQGLSQGTMDLVKAARIIEKVQSGMTLIQATVKVDNEMKAEQAALADQQQAAATSPEATGALPEAQPGLGGAPAAPVPGTPAAPAGKPSLQDLLSSLGGVPPETQPNAVAQAPAPAPAGV